MQACPTEAELLDAVEGRLALDQQRWVLAHLQSCASCRELVDGIFEPGDDDEASLAASADPLIGATLGEYVVEERIGQGGMGVVYRGRQPLIGKQVAIKLLRHAVTQDPRGVQRLLDEAKSVNAIGHRGIIDIFSFGQLPDGRHYIVMEYLVGTPLDHYLRARGAMPAHEVMTMLDDVLAALAAAHGAGIVHRDLKPSNLFVVSQPDGTRFVKVLDFGLARQLRRPPGEETQNRVIGTPEYMAPEQIRAVDVGPWSDLYALGVIAWQMLTGKRPFDDVKTRAVYRWHLETPAVAPSLLVKDIPVPFELWVLALLEKDWRQRPHSAGDLRQELKRMQRQLSVEKTHELHSVQTDRSLRAFGDEVDLSSLGRLPDPRQVLSMPTPDVRGQGATVVVSLPEEQTRLLAGTGDTGEVPVTADANPAEVAMPAATRATYRADDERPKPTESGRVPANRPEVSSAKLAPRGEVSGAHLVKSPSAPAAAKSERPDKQPEVSGAHLAKSSSAPAARSERPDVSAGASPADRPAVSGAHVAKSSNALAAKSERPEVSAAHAKPLPPTIVAERPEVSGSHAAKSSAAAAKSERPEAKPLPPTIVAERPEVSGSHAAKSGAGAAKSERAEVKSQSGLAAKTESPRVSAPEARSGKLAAARPAPRPIDVSPTLAEARPPELVVPRTDPSVSAFPSGSTDPSLPAKTTELPASRLKPLVPWLVGALAMVLLGTWALLQLVPHEVVEPDAAVAAPASDFEQQVADRSEALQRRVAERPDSQRNSGIELALTKNLEDLRDRARRAKTASERERVTRDLNELERLYR